MRKRNIRLMIRLNEKENILLIDKVRKSGLSKEAYIRYLISGYIPMEKPSQDFFDMIDQLRRIGNNINQLVMIAHKTGSIDIARYKRDIAELNKNILEIREKVLLPEENSDGNNYNMGCQRQFETCA